MEIQQKTNTSTTTTTLMEVGIGNSAQSLQTFLELQKQLFHNQIDQLQNIVVTQCKLTGTNPLSQEMAAGALSVNIGKRPRDLLNPKGVKYMQSVFSIKDTISKKETREISALCGVTVTQVREFFASQRSRVRKHVRLAREKATKSDASKTSENECSTSSDPATSIIDQAPLNTLAPEAVTVAPPTSSQDEVIPGIEASDKNFIDNIFNLMRREEKFSGQVKLMEWIMRIQNPSVLCWFLTKGGLMILAAWLSNATIEEQTTVLLVTLKVLCHLPLQKALPVQMSAILQTVNRLRFYRTTDISNRAKVLLSRWSKLFFKSQALKRPSSTDSPNDTHKQIINKQRTSENNQAIVNLPEDILAFTYENSEDCRKSEPPQALKLLPASTDESNRKHARSVSSTPTRERRKVLLVEQPGRNASGRSLQIARPVTSTQGRPMSTDDIQKAKMRASFMQSKYGKSVTSSNDKPLLKAAVLNRNSTSQARHLISACKSPVRPEIEENRDQVSVAPETFPALPEVIKQNTTSPESRKPVAFPTETTTTTTTMVESPVRPEISSPVRPEISSPIRPETSSPVRPEISSPVLPEISSPVRPSWENLKRDQIPWQMPSEIKINSLWRVGAGEKSKEVEIQRDRTRREKETTYQRTQDIPSDPRDPWDREMDYDDSLTLEIPMEQPSDVDTPAETSSSSYNNIQNPAEASTSNLVPVGSSEVKATESVPDFELLAVLLKNPELVFALTSGQVGNITSQDTVKLLDMIKTSGIDLAGNLSGLMGGNIGNMGQPVNPLVTSLPSPTPPSEIRMNQWRSNDSISQPIVAANRETAHFQAAAPNPTTILGTGLIQAQQQYPLMNQENHHLGVNSYSISSSSLPNIPQIQTQIQPTVSSLQQSILTAALPLLQPESVSYGQFHNVKPAPVSMVTNHPSKVPSMAALLSTTMISQPPQVVQEPTQQSWQWNDNGHNRNDMTQVNHNNYSAFGGGPSGPAMYQSQTLDRDEYFGEQESEGWSPDRSPGYHSGRNMMPELRRGTNGRNSRNDWSTRRDTGGGGGRRDFSRQGGGNNRRWRDRRY